MNPIKKLRDLISRLTLPKYYFTDKYGNVYIRAQSDTVLYSVYHGVRQNIFGAWVHNNDVVRISKLVTNGNLTLTLRIS